jgi:hypothetical protein
MGTYVRYYCPLKKQQLQPSHVNGLSGKSHHQPERVDIGRLLVHLLSGYGDGPHWFLVCLAHDGTPRVPDGGLPDYDTVRQYEDVTELAVTSYNDAWPNSAAEYVYDPPLHVAVEKERRAREKKP